jgi:hypothetical protein
LRQARLASNEAVLTMLTLRRLPLAFRALFSCFLIVIGIGYLAALSLLFLVDIKPNLGAGKSVVEDISEQYHGLPSDTRLEMALNGPMATMASPDERKRILDWIHTGVTRKRYAAIAPIFKNNCMSCRNPQVNRLLPPRSPATMRSGNWSKPIRAKTSFHLPACRIFIYSASASSS